MNHHIAQTVSFHAHSNANSLTCQNLQRESVEAKRLDDIIKRPLGTRIEVGLYKHKVFECNKPILKYVVSMLTEIANLGRIEQNW